MRRAQATAVGMLTAVPHTERAHMWNWLRRWAVGLPSAPLIVVRRPGPPETAQEIYDKVGLWLKGLTPCLVVSEDVRVEALFVAR